MTDGVSYALWIALSLCAIRIVHNTQYDTVYTVSQKHETLILDITDDFSSLALQVFILCYTAIARPT